MSILLSTLFLYQSTISIHQNLQQEPEIRDLNYIDISYRPERGANPEWLLSEFPRYKRLANQAPTLAEIQEEKIAELRTDFINENFPNEYHIDQTISQINGKDLERERDYTNDKQKIIIHHSAMPTTNIQTQEEMFEHLQEIYELHCFYRERGDIGYNFFIDKWGNIYEGKAGGPSIVGAHTQFNNYDSVGINLLGNLNNEEPSDEQLKSLISLIIALTQKYNIDLNEETLYFERIETPPYIESIYGNPIGYHKMVYNTACPGTNMLDKIDFIRNFATSYQKYFSTTSSQTEFINQIRTGLNLERQTSELDNFLHQQSNNQVNNYEERYQTLLKNFQAKRFTTGQNFDEITNTIYRIDSHKLRNSFQNTKKL